MARKSFIKAQLEGEYIVAYEQHSIDTIYTEQTEETYKIRGKIGGKYELSQYLNEVRKEHPNAKAKPWSTNPNRINLNDVRIAGGYTIIPSKPEVKTREDLSDWAEFERHQQQRRRIIRRYFTIYLAASWTDGERATIEIPVEITYIEGFEVEAKREATNIARELVEKSKAEGFDRKGFQVVAE